MVNATVDNEAISILLGENESTTVPSGEVWKVTIMGDGTDTMIKINNSKVATWWQSENYADVSDVVLVGGDTIKNGDGSQSGHLHVSGFVVNN